MSDGVERANVISLFLGALTLLLIGLKLTGHIDWSWWLVWAPIWFLPASVLCVLLIVASLGAMSLFILIIRDWWKKRPRCR